MQSALLYSTSLDQIPYNAYFSQYGSDTIYKKLMSPFSPTGFTYQTHFNGKVISINAKPPPGGMFYLCTAEGTCLQEDIPIQEDWLL